MPFNKKSKDIVYNTYGDIKDYTIYWSVEDDGLKEHCYKDDIVHSLDGEGFRKEEKSETIHTPAIGDASRVYFEESDNCLLSRLIDKLPHGIIDKKITGIGATTLEIESKRHSIIVVPTRILAFNKYSKHPNSLYIGSEIKGYSVSDDNIKAYINDKEKTFKKFIVVAESLERLIKYLISLSIDIYNEYFLMIDEIDQLQENSHYRPKLECVIDYYFKFNIKKRCLISATINNFSNPKFEDECRFNLNNILAKKRAITLYFTNEINSAVKKQILAIQEGKIFIAYNSVSQAKKIIESLEESLRKECAILCSQSSTESAKPFYNELDEVFSLPKRINFVTSSFFAGIDIQDSYHLITVSNTKKAYQALGINKITQIYGRCRIKDGILSDTIIYNTTDYEPKFKRSTAKYRDTLIKKANKVLDVIKAADIIQEKDKDLEDLFKVVKKAIHEKGIETPFRGQPIPLTRETIKEGKYGIAYLNIDFLTEREQLFNELYVNQEKLYKALISEGHQVTQIEYQDNRTQEERQREKELEDQIQENSKEIKDTLLSATIADLKEKVEKFPTRAFNKYISGRLRTCTKEEKPIIERFIDLNKYVESDKLLDCLYEIRHKNTKAFNNLNNTIMFWCQAEDHPLRINIREAFETGKEYTPEEIHQKIEPIVKYHFHKTIKPRTSISLFRAYFEVSRPRNSYVVIKENPLNFEERKISIGKKENNLMEYFIIN